MPLLTDTFRDIVQINYNCWHKHRCTVIHGVSEKFSLSTQTAEHVGLHVNQSDIYKLKMSHSGGIVDRYVMFTQSFGHALLAIRIACVAG